MSTFTFTAYCLECGGHMDADSDARVHPIEATLRVTCRVCRAGATLRVLLANRCAAPVEVRSIEP